MDEESETNILSEFVDLLGKPEETATSLLWNKSSGKTITPVLRETTKQLFRQVEHIAKLYRSHVEGTDEGETLSGLEELYMGDGEEVDSETLWGQVDLQNEALQHLLKTSIRKLSKVSSESDNENEIRLLDDLESGNEQPSDDEDSGDDDEKEDDSDKEDEDARRMRERMERAMADMEDDSENLEEDEQPTTTQESYRRDEEDIVDPAAEELNNGFFDINEMEAFADEEEEYLPDSAYGEEKPEKDVLVTDKRSFHQRQRDGDTENASEDSASDEDSESEDLLFRKESLVRRKKYRQDDEVEALYSLYGKPTEDDDNVEVDVINMTATDFFGKPDKKYFGKWKAQNNKTKNLPEDDKVGADDDSWNDYDFNTQRQDGEEPSMWDNERNHDEDDESEQSVKNDDEQNVEELKHKSQKKSKLDSQTEELEKEMMAEKPWQMTGEATSTARPTNSLLESTPEFEVATKMAPIITVEHTESLEEVIKARILEEDWDDVVPRELPDIGWHSKRGELPEVSQEKSKLGLGELYEREYLKKAVGYDKDAAEEESEEQKAKNEIKSLFANLCSKLDALSNYHFAPRPIEHEAEIRPVTKPAIAMEEVLPLHVSDARGVAPEEVYGKKHGRESVLRADSELEQQDRKRLRTAKKSARRKKRKQKQADEKLISRLQPGLGLNNPYEKRKMREELQVARARGTVTTGKKDTNEYGGSGTFFKRMQEQAQQSIKGGNSAAAEEESSARKQSRSSSYKL